MYINDGKALRFVNSAGNWNSLSIAADMTVGNRAVLNCDDLRVNGANGGGGATLTVNGAFGVTGATTLGGTLGVTGATTLGGPLGVINADVSVNGGTLNIYKSGKLSMFSGSDNYSAFKIYASGLDGCLWADNIYVFNLWGNAGGNVILSGTGYFQGAAFNVSDIRIKKNLSNINDGDALNALRKIEPTEYEYIDVTRGTSRVYGFIAQQVHEHFPNAVIIKNEIIPDIYSIADYSLASTIPITTYSAATSSFQSTSQYIYTLNISSGILSSLQLNSTLRLCDTYGAHIDGKITYTDNYSTVQMTVDKVPELKDDPANPGKILVYGKEVNDLHILNKDYLFTMNFAATQEIDRQMQSTMARVSVLEDTVLALEATVLALKDTVLEQQAQISTLIGRFG
jgi:hypothetical protein